MPILFEYIKSRLDFFFFLFKDVNRRYFNIVAEKTLALFLI
jgi:hypothetical protein